MSTILWPPLPSNPASTLGQQVDETRQRELSWLLSALQETLSSLKSGLEDCSSLLAPREQGSTLVVSSHRSEALKGFVTRNGSNITKGDIQLRLASLPPPRGQTSYKLSISTSPSAPALQVKQIAEVRTLINSSLDVVDATAWTGDKGDANFISGQLTLLHENIRDAKAVLKGSSAGSESDKSWASDPLDEKVRALSFNETVFFANAPSRSLTLHLHPTSLSTSASQTPHSSSTSAPSNRHPALAAPHHSLVVHRSQASVFAIDLYTHSVVAHELQPTTKPKTSFPTAVLKSESRRR